MENDVLNTIFARSAIRGYTSEPLTDDELETLADSALAAPTAMNLQSQRFFFITDNAIILELEKAVGEMVEKTGTPEFKKRMKDRCGKVFYDAPLFVLIAIDDKNTYAKADAGIAAQTLALSAKSLGLDSVILGLPALAFQSENAKTIKEHIGMPENLSYGLGIAIGHCNIDKAPHDVDSSHVIYVR